MSESHSFLHRFLDNVATRYISLIVALLCLAWFGSELSRPGFPWEPLIGFVPAMVSFLYSYVSREREVARLSEQAVQRANDALLFKQFVELLPSEGPIEFARTQDFLATFQSEWMTPFNRFSATWNNPAHEFIDPEMERQRYKFLRACNYFTDAVGHNTAPRGIGFQSVVPQDLPSDGPLPDWIKKEAAEITAAAEAVVDEHQKLMRLGRRKLPLD